MFRARIAQHPVGVFFAATLAISACIAAIAKATNNENLSILIVFSPTLTAIFITGIGSPLAERRFSSRMRPPIWKAN